MDHPKDHAFPDIPEDVCRLIFEIAAEENDSDPTYALVSKRVQSWVEPVIYRKVSVSGRFHRTIMDTTSSKAPNFFAIHVKSLMFEEEGDGVVAEILRKCTSIQALALWYGSPPNAPETLHALTTPGLLSPTHLSLSRFLFQKADSTSSEEGDAFSHTIFSSVTHLDLSCPHNKDDWPWSSLSNLEHLTHLNLDLYFQMEDPTHLAGTILSFCPPTLRVLIISICDSPNASRKVFEALKTLSKGDVDPRIVVAAYSDEWSSLIGERINMMVIYDELKRAWSTTSHENKLWARAEQVTQTRRGPVRSEALAWPKHAARGAPSPRIQLPANQL